MMKNEIHVSYGTDYLKMTYELLKKMKIAKELNATMSIAIKPNLVVAKDASSGATTTPVIVEGIIQYLRANGITNISIMEGSWVGDNTKQAFEVCGYRKLANKYDIPLYDLKDDDFTIKQIDDLNIEVCRKPLEVDYLINVPVLKAHCQTMLTCAIKNLKGCITDNEKRRFHRLGLMKPIAYLGKALTPSLTIVDSIAGDLTFEEGGNPVRMDRIFAGKDIVLLDAYAASLLGYSPDEIEYIGIAESIGAGSANISKANIYEYNSELKKAEKILPSNRAQQLARKVIAREACSACYGGLIHALQRMSDNKTLNLLKDPIYIGQGFKEQPINGIGIGSCTKNCTQYIHGCPPTAKSIVEFLEAYIKA